MSDPISNLAQPLRDDDSTHQAKIEELLITGLDEYFRGEYELAISRWTRVLFFDRTHARARAYIERARNALAERQREAEELLHAGLEAFERGDIAAARALLSSAVQQGGPHEAAVALLGRIDRLEPVHPGRAGVRAPAVRTRVRVSVPSPSEGAAPRRWGSVLAVIGLAVAAGVLSLAFFTDVLDRTVLLPRTGSVVSQPPPALHLPSRALLSIERARKLFDRGHLHEALATLETIPDADPLRPEADAVQSAIQRMLLTSAATGLEPAASSGPERPAGPR